MGSIKDYLEYVIIFSMFLVGGSVFYQSFAVRNGQTILTDLQQNDKITQINSRLAAISTTLSNSITGLGIIDLPLKLLLIGFQIIVLVAFDGLDLVGSMLNLIAIKIGVSNWLLLGATTLVILAILWRLLLITLNRQEDSD